MHSFRSHVLSFFVIISLEFLHSAWEMATLDQRMLLVPMMPDLSVISYGKLSISYLLHSNTGRQECCYRS